MAEMPPDKSSVDAPDAQILNLRIQYVSAGHHKRVLARTDTSSFNVHCYASGGGENGMHAHMAEDHVFLVLEGEAQFVTPKGPLPRLRRHQALFIPKGAYYSFSAEGGAPLVLARFGAAVAGAGPDRRLDPDGRFIPGRAKQTSAVAPVLIEGRFFE